MEYKAIINGPKMKTNREENVVKGLRNAFVHCDVQYKSNFKKEIEKITLKNASKKTKEAYKYEFKKEGLKNFIFDVGNLI